MFQALVGDEWAEQVQPAEVFHVGQRRQRIVQDIRVPQVERLQVDQGLETGRVFDRGVVEPKMLQLRQGRQSFYALVPDVEPGERGQAGMEFLQLLHSLVILEGLVRERGLDVAHRAPDPCRNVEFTNVGELAERLQLLGLGNRAVHVDDDDSEVARGQVERIADGFLETVHYDLAAAAEDPQSNGPLLEGRNLSERGKCQEASQD